MTDTPDPIAINVGKHLAMAAQTLEAIEQKDVKGFSEAGLTVLAVLELSAIAHSLLAIGALLFLQHDSLEAHAQGITSEWEG